MSLIHYNSLRIDGNNNIVLQDVVGSQISLTIDAFINNITEEKDKRIADLERTIADKTKIEHFSDAEIQRLGRELTQLKEERLFQEQRIEEMLREFDGKDLSTTSKMYQEAFNLFVSGKLQEAIDFLAEDKMAAEEAKAQAIIKQQAENRLLKADMLVLTFAFIEAAHNYEKAVALFPSWENHEIVANFYYKQKNYQKVERHYLLALDYAENEHQNANTLNNLGEFYRVNQKMAQAEAAYTKALSLKRQLAVQNPAAFLPSVADTLNNLGLYYSANQKMPQAETAYTEALSLRRHLAAQNPAAFLPKIAGILNNMGTHYYNNQKMLQAEAAYTEALSLYRQLEAQNPDAFLIYVATTLNNLGIYYSKNHKMPQAEAALTEALSIRRQLADRNPAAFLTDVATTLNNLGIYHGYNRKMPQAEAAYLDALSIYQHLATQNPDAFLPSVANTLNNLVLFYLENPEEAEKYLKESLPITRMLAEQNPDAQNLELARTLIIGGLVYKALENTTKSQEFLKEALFIAEHYPQVPFAQKIIRDAKENIQE